MDSLLEFRKCTILIFHNAHLAITHLTLGYCMMHMWPFHNAHLLIVRIILKYTLDYCIKYTWLLQNAYLIVVQCIFDYCRMHTCLYFYLLNVSYLPKKKIVIIAALLLRKVSPKFCMQCYKYMFLCFIMSPHNIYMHHPHEET